MNRAAGVTSRAAACMALVSVAESLLWNNPEACAGTQATKTINGFNDEAERSNCTYAKALKVELVAEHVTEGTKSVKLTCPPNRRWTGFNVRKELLARWGDYDYFTFDIFNPYDKDVVIYVRIDDDQSRQSDYSTQYGRGFKLQPGANQVKIKLSRMPNQVQPWLQRKLNPNTLKLVAIWFPYNKTEETVLYFDNVSLRNAPRAELPEAMRCFDFGSADADCWPGFTHVTRKSKYTDETGYGFNDTRNLRAIDDSFGEGLKHGEALVGTSIYRGGPLTFAVKVDPGRYKIWGATGMSIHPKRAYSVTCNGQPIFTCKAGDRLKDLDPFGRDYTRKSTIWETLFLGQICDEFMAEVEIKNGKTEITVAGEYASWLSGGLRALIVYPVGNAEAEKGFGEVQKQRRSAFLEKWRELKPAKLQSPAAFTADEQARGFMLAYRHYAERISPHFVPVAEDRLKAISIAATPGEMEPAVFIVYPTRDSAKAEVRVSALSGPAGAIPASAITIDYVHYRYVKARGGGLEAVASHVVPRNWLALEKGIPRQFWLTVKVPGNAAPGKYTGTVTVSAAGGQARFPLEAEVYPFKLDTVADCGLIYAHIWSVPEAREDVEAVVKCLAEHNVNSATLSGVIKLKGKNPKTGKPTFEFSRLDMAMETMRKAGMTGPVPLFDMSIQGEGGGNSYPHLGFTRAPYNYKVTDSRYFDAIAELTRQVKERAEAKNYLPVLMYPVTELSNDPHLGPPYLEKLVKAFRRVEGVELICSLNTPKDIVCAKLLDHMMVNWGLKLTEERLARIRDDGAKLWFQNIGQSRYTEGFLMLKAGAIGRRQWIVSGGAGGRVHAGDPFNSLMGGGNSSVLFRAPDRAVPNITLKWMSEGADDYRYASKLLRLVKEANESGTAEAKAVAAEARKAYDKILAAIRINTGGARIESDGRCDNIGDFFDKSTYDGFRRTIAKHIILLQEAAGK